MSLSQQLLYLKNLTSRLYVRHFDDHANVKDEKKQVYADRQTEISKRLKHNLGLLGLSDMLNVRPIIAQS